MPTTPTTFDPAIAAEYAARSVRESLAALRDEAEQESLEAISAAEAYARHLADGGSPLEGFDREYRIGGAKYVKRTPVLERIYAEWNRVRGSRNPYSAVSDSTGWQVAEYALERVGQPMLFSDLREAPTLFGRGYHGSISSDDIAQALAGLQGDDLVLRRTKVGGKVAYLLRERKQGEEFVGKMRPDGVHVSVFASSVPEERWTP